MREVDISPVPSAKLASYRPDIDGLRAVAVVAVVVFHAFPEALPGGFIGVDIFFVISGFLITSIILKALAAERFSFVDFYSRRVRRIFPTLIVVLAACFGLGWFLLFGWEFRQLGWDIASGAGFAANFALWSEAGYFDRAAETKVLLHLWSLGVEEQFYLLFPLIFWLGHRYRVRASVIITALLGLSFAINIATYESHPTAAFYSPASRFWELLCGSLLAAFALRVTDGRLVKNAALGTALSLLGFGLLAVACALGTPKTPFPGWFALLPVLGASAIIAAGRHAVPNAWFLSSAPMRWVGGVSYPLYLWHWPLLVFARISKSGTPPPEQRALLVVAAVVLAWLTCVAVENRLRFGAHNRVKVFALASALAVVAVLGAATRKLNGFPSRAFTALNVDLSFQNVESIENTAFGCGIEDESLAARIDRCLHDTRGKPTIALMGDSKARSLSAGLFRHSDADSRVLFIGGTKDDVVPLPLLSDDPTYASFQPWTKLALDAIRKNEGIRLVILTMSTRALYGIETDRSLEELPGNPLQPAVVEGLDRMVKALAGAGKKVLVTIDNPTLPPPEDCIQRRSSWGLLNQIFPPRTTTCAVTYDKHLELSALYRAALGEVRRRNPNIFEIFDTLPLLCDMQERVCRSVEQGQLYYAYTDHLSDLAAEKIGKQLMPFAKNFAGLGARHAQLQGEHAAQLPSHAR